MDGIRTDESLWSISVKLPFAPLHWNKCLFVFCWVLHCCDFDVEPHWIAWTNSLFFLFFGVGSVSWIVFKPWIFALCTTWNAVQSSCHFCEPTMWSLLLGWLFGFCTNKMFEKYTYVLCFLSELQQCALHCIAGRFVLPVFSPYNNRHHPNCVTDDKYKGCVWESPDGTGPHRHLTVFSQ